MNPIEPSNLDQTQAGYAGYHHFIDDSGHEFGSFEVFWSEGPEFESDAQAWYWWPCYPGCLPDSEDYNGPFETPLAAFIDARESGS